MDGPLGILLHNGFTEINGWYNVMDFVGRCRGQISVNIKPKNKEYIFNMRSQQTTMSSTHSPQEPRNIPKDDLVKVVYSQKDFQIHCRLQFFLFSSSKNFVRGIYF